MEWIAVTLLGLAWGSFANVVILRVPAREEWVSTPSHCMACSRPLAWYENVPVASWVALRGRCRTCRARVSAQYPLIEVIVAMCFVGVYASVGATFLGVALALLAFASVCWTVIDVRIRRLPDAITAPIAMGMVAMLLAHSWWGQHWESLARAGMGAAILGGFYGLMWLVHSQGMGFGDVKVAAVLGLGAGYLGWQHLAVAGIAGPLLGGLVVLAGMVRGALHRKSAIPYGPPLIAGAWVGIVAGTAIAEWYVRLVI